MGDNRAVADIDCDTGVLIRHSTFKRRQRSMGRFDSFFRRGTSHSAMSIYKRGIAKAKKHDHEGAIDDYSAAIDMSDAPPDVKAMALYNRALVHAANRDNTKAVNDLKTVLAMAAIPTNVKAAADEKLKRIERRSDGHI